MEDNILLNENAYFYKKPDNFNLSSSNVNAIFKDASKSAERLGNYLLKAIKKIHTYQGENIFYSICVFKYETKPTFINEPIENWNEVKLAYLIIVEFENYIVISKKNISGISDFIKQLEPLDYKILSTIFINERTHFEKFSLKNMNISDRAIRNKSLEAVDLQENFSPLGAGSYVVDNLRLNTDNEKIALSLNTSRINKFGAKNSISDFTEWSRGLIDLIDNYEEQSTFLSVFAEPQDFEKQRDELIPIAILFLFTKLHDDYENGRIVEFKYVSGTTSKRFDIFRHLEKFERLCQIRTFEDDDGSIIYYAENKVANDLEVKLNKKSITISSSKLINVKYVSDTGIEKSLLDLVNSSNQFIVNFDHLDLIYTSRKLFRDSRLVGNIDYFLDVFLPSDSLNDVTSEKGNFITTSTNFEKSSVFGFVESEFEKNHEYFICDDLGKEWADHIGLSEGRVSFYHSKYKESSFSASAFQDIVGQALKNMSSLTPADYQLELKRGLWGSYYNNDTIKTEISRLRKGDSVVNAITYFNDIIRNPNLSREIFIVVNFISKSALKIKLNQLRDGEAFKERNEVIQILWFISSYISSCSEQGIRAFVCCKP